MLEIAHTEPHWFSQVSTVDDTGIIPNERLAVEEREIIKQYGEIQGTAYFQQEFFCSFESPILGAVYAEALQHLEAEGRICPLKIEPGVPVHTGWDLGVRRFHRDMVHSMRWPQSAFGRLLRIFWRAIAPLCRGIARKADQEPMALRSALPAP
jgi:hypothetical protein